MNLRYTGRNAGKWVSIALTIAGAAVLLVEFSQNYLRGQSPGNEEPGSSQVFTPAHSSVGEAVRHFFGMRRTPEQPIPFTHKVHVQGAGLKCDSCHESVTKGPVAHLPSVLLCISCHEEVGTNLPSIQKLMSYYQKGQEVPWERVYGWNEEAHVRFNHAPHIRAAVDCATCHGNVAQMTVAEREVDHTMGFCVNCHKEKKASIDCLTCHY